MSGTVELAAILLVLLVGVATVVLFALTLLTEDEDL